jgi:hypothetical protein
MFRQMKYCMPCCSQTDIGILPISLLAFSDLRRPRCRPISGGALSFPKISLSRSWSRPSPHRRPSARATPPSLPLFRFMPRRVLSNVSRFDGCTFPLSRLSPRAEIRDASSAHHWPQLRETEERDRRGRSVIRSSAASAIKCLPIRGGRAAISFARQRTLASKLSRLRSRGMVSR